MFRACQPLLFLGLALLASCDGGLRVNRQGNPCTENLVTLRVEVVDARGTAVRDATVTATHVDTGHTITGTTGDRGVTTAVNEDIGEGTVRLTATSGSKVSAPAEVTWTCDECHCHPEPATVRLQLNP
ncbi:carboxypeptidase regulatory-like domain-containing protein [Archangium sp.]|uniref:carboxypeptidase regulatory-like domain-containing protein n=1 Tax=Archangium sp. TaxID=1872627 RepID=UPI002D46E1E1|nr:carboxypeptidase regulatory-like domain-containing protein [Archangium sp.]HYO59454.1 carboxypeptidase regulatory-like domain-containing protein [Archangium sp.]